MHPSSKRYILVFGAAAVSIALDQLTKVWAWNTLQGEPVRHYFNDMFRILFVQNEGAFLSLGADLSDELRMLALTLLPVIILAFLLVYTLRSRTLNTWQVVAYSFIFGGGVSNIYDRILYGKVVDFMNMGIGDLRTGIFNVADVFIMIGLFMLIPYIFIPHRKPATDAGQSA